MNTENNNDNTDTITVQDTEIAPIAPEPIQSGWTSMIPMVLIFVVFYFLLIRPQEKRRRAQENLVSSVKKGEEVMTSTGLFGVISKINDSDNTIMLQVAKEVEVKILKSSISDIVGRKNIEEKEKKKSK